MKKLSIFILVLSLMLFSASALADSHVNMMEQGTWTLGIDYDMGGSLTTTNPNDDGSDVSGGFTLNGEYIIPYKNNMSYGGGIAYQLSRSLKDNEAKEINFMPLYGIFKYDMENEAYVIGHLGYNVFSGNDAYKDAAELSGGLYYAVGAGIDMQEKYNGELIYSVNKGNRGNYEVSYSKLTLSFGYEF